MVKSSKLLLFCAMMAQSLMLRAAAADNVQQPTDTTYVYISPERLDVYPPAYVQSLQKTSKRVIITTTDGQQHTYRTSLIDSVSTCHPDSLPRITSFKFNNKFNDQVFTDVIADIVEDSVITASVPAIGKRLTPSFQLSDELACAYVDGVRQHSKKSRLRFEESVYYTVARPGWQIVGPAAVPVEPTDDPGSGSGDDQPSGSQLTKIELTADMLSTNAPSNYPDTEDLDKLLDDDLGTFFHSTWGSGLYEKLPLDQSPYIDIALPEALRKIQFSYINRGADGYYPLELALYAGGDGETWTFIRSFTVEADNLPTEALGVYQSPDIDLGADYTHLRIEQKSGAHKNYLAWAEFSLYKVNDQTAPNPDDSGSGSETPDTDPEPPADDNDLVWTPFGRTYRVAVDWPTDRSVMTPSIFIDTEGGEVVKSKDYYLEATFSIDGAGVFPDMEPVPMQIKGRGNSSWETPRTYSWGEDTWTYEPKNPYRLKFYEKQKPFGLTKGKSWVLQSNKQTGSMMVNGIGMKAGHLMGAVATNHVIPVELYMNGEYCGSYIFNEKLGFANNSIELEDESAAVRIELDSYSEAGQFRTNNYYLPVNIKEPDFNDPETFTRITREDVINDFNAFVDAVYYNDDIESWVDVDYLVAFLSANELVANYELNHPKSTFLYKENVNGFSKYVFGPIWDLDWAYGYEGSSTYFSNASKDDFYNKPKHKWNDGSNGRNTDKFWHNLRYASENVDRAYYKLWTRFLTQGGIDELLEYCDDYFNYAEPSFLHNAERWWDGSDYASSKEKAKSWLRKRADYIYSLLTPYDLSGELDQPEQWEAYASNVDNDDEEDPDAVTRTQRPLTRFTVHDLRGILIKRDATFNTWRDGLAPGLYIVNGKKVLVQ